MYSTASITSSNTTATIISGLDFTVTIPSNATTVVTFDGVMKSGGPAIGAIALQVDGTTLTRGQKLVFLPYDDSYFAFGTFSSTMTLNLAAGDHSFRLLGWRNTGADSVVLCGPDGPQQCAVTVTILKK